MTGYELLLLIHLLLFVYWLGGDLGVFYTAGYLSRSDLPPATRAVVAKIMLALDMVPRICLVLMLPVGVALSAGLGLLSLPGWVPPALFVFAILWLALVWTIHARERQPIAATLARIDWAVRITVVVGMAAASLSVLSEGQGWLAAKMAIFAVTIVCGLIIRVRLKPFGTWFGRLMTEGSSPEVEVGIARSIAQVKPAVLLIWAGLVVNAWLGLAKPF